MSKSNLNCTEYLPKKMWYVVKLCKAYTKLSSLINLNKITLHDFYAEKNLMSAIKSLKQ